MQKKNKFKCLTGPCRQACLRWRESSPQSWCVWKYFCDVLGILSLSCLKMLFRSRITIITLIFTKTIGSFHFHTRALITKHSWKCKHLKLITYFEISKPSKLLYLYQAIIFFKYSLDCEPPLASCYHEGVADGNRGALPSFIFKIQHCPRAPSELLSPSGAFILKIPLPQEHPLWAPVTWLACV